MKSDLIKPASLFVTFSHKKTFTIVVTIVFTIVVTIVVAIVVTIVVALSKQTNH
jgi:MFS superfamily sulfate permease-like transporter